MEQFREEWKGKAEVVPANDTTRNPDFYVEDLHGHGMRICMASSVKEAIDKLDSFGLKYGHKADITSIKVVPGDEVVNIGIRWS